MEVYFNGDHIGTVPKAETKRISLPSGGDVEFVTKTPPSGLIKRFSMTVEDGDELELVALTAALGSFTIAPPKGWHKRFSGEFPEQG